MTVQYTHGRYTYNLEECIESNANTLWAELFQVGEILCKFRCVTRAC